VGAVDVRRGDEDMRMRGGMHAAHKEKALFISFYNPHVFACMEY